jgi:hypothetical protein
MRDVDPYSIAQEHPNDMRRLLAILTVAITSMTTFSYSDEISVFKSGGDVDVTAAPDGARVTTMGGDITVHSVRRFANLKTNGGNISVESASGSVAATTMSGNITVHVVDRGDGEAEQTIVLTSNSGEVSLYLPHDFGATIDIRLSCTEDQAALFSIVDNLGLRQRDGGRSRFWKGTRRRYIDANGVVGDGATRIVIRTINGNVRVHLAPG